MPAAQEVRTILEKALSLVGAGPWKFLTAAVVSVAAIASANPSSAPSAYGVIAVIAAISVYVAGTE